MTEELMTEKEKERLKRNNEIRGAFDELRAKYPALKDWRLYGELSRRYNLSIMMIRNIVSE